MDGSNAGESPLEAATGAAGAHVIDTFQLLSNGTRLAILLALWEGYEPYDTDDAVAFSTLYDRVGVRDSGTFTYHLDRLVGPLVEATGDGYRLRNAGLKIVQAIIAGAGLEERTLPSTEIDLSCHRCGAPVEISYENEHLYHVCTECEGNAGPTFADERPVGTLMMFDFHPAGLAGRDPGEVFVAGTIKSLGEFGLLIRGICPECSGPVEEAVHVCGSHEATPGKACPTCGTGDEVRVSYVCSVCKHGDSYPVHAAIYDHPAVVSFCHEHGIVATYDLDDPEACGELWDHLLQRTYTLVSEEPVRVRVSVPGDGATLHLLLDEDLDVVDVTEEERDPGRSSSEDGRTPHPAGGDAGSRAPGRRTRAADDLLPDREDCLRRLRRHRWPEGITCPHCDGSDTIKKGTTRKDAQRYRCRACDRVFNDLTGTVFANRRLSIPEMFHIVRTTDEFTTARIARQLGRSYKSVLDFVHEVRDDNDGDAESIPPAAVGTPNSIPAERETTPST